MKNLKDYVIESVWDIEDNVESDNKEFVLNGVKQFIKDNYSVVDLKSLTFVFDEEKEKYIVSTRGGLRLSTEAKSLTNGLFEWGVVGGFFNCDNCPELESLEGAPKTIGKYFDCHGCKKLESLKGAPKTVGGVFSCFGCNELKSLKGAPEYVGWNFYCSNCSK